MFFDGVNSQKPRNAASINDDTRKHENYYPTESDSPQGTQSIMEQEPLNYNPGVNYSSLSAAEASVASGAASTEILGEPRATMQGHEMSVVPSHEAVIRQESETGWWNYLKNPIASIINSCCPVNKTAANGDILKLRKLSSLMTAGRITPVADVHPALLQMWIKADHDGDDDTKQRFLDEIVASMNRRRGENNLMQPAECVALENELNSRSAEARDASRLVQEPGNAARGETISFLKEEFSDGSSDPVFARIEELRNKAEEQKNRVAEYEMRLSSDASRGNLAIGAAKFAAEESSTCFDRAAGHLRSSIGKDADLAEFCKNLADQFEITANLELDEARACESSMSHYEDQEFRFPLEISPTHLKEIKDKVDFANNAVSVIRTMGTSRKEGLIRNSHLRKNMATAMIRAFEYSNEKVRCSREAMKARRDQASREEIEERRRLAWLYGVASGSFASEYRDYLVGNLFNNAGTSRASGEAALQEALELEQKIAGTYNDYLLK